MSFMELSLLLGKKHRGQSLNQEAAIFSPFSVTDRSTRASPSAMSPDTPTMDVKDDWGSATNDFDDSFDESIVHLDCHLYPWRPTDLPFSWHILLLLPIIQQRSYQFYHRCFVELQHISFVREDTSFSAMSIILTQTQMRLVKVSVKVTKQEIQPPWSDYSIDLSKFFIRTLGYIHSVSLSAVSIDATLSTPVLNRPKKTSGATLL
ncbi:hypothetical protein BASA83_003158 [Batrachochytrium salamandrivorans]|nr:hypothetical protein BASA83_003158 [Batrachochytrium salamandrivorans]